MRPFLIIAGLIVAGITAGCSPVYVSQDYDRDVDFSRYKTFAWLPAEKDAAEKDAPATARQAQQQDPFTIKHLKAEVEAQLEEKGMSLSEHSPDLFVNYYLTGQSAVDIQQTGYGRGFGGGNTTARHYEEGTLVVDLIDAEKNVLVWTGTAEATLGEYPTPDQVKQKISSSVKKLLGQYPPKK
jgi:hypothetical protein